MCGLHRELGAYYSKKYGKTVEIALTVINPNQNNKKVGKSDFIRMSFHTYCIASDLILSTTGVYVVSEMSCCFLY